MENLDLFLPQTGEERTPEKLGGGVRALKPDTTEYQGARLFTTEGVRTKSQLQPFSIPLRSDLVNKINQNTKIGLPNFCSFPRKAP